LGLETKQRKISIEFSPDGNYLALLYRKKTAILKIYRIDEYDIERCLRNIKKSVVKDIPGVPYSL
jgi:hypothetical protein